jgi:hypothetical protein
MRHLLVAWAAVLVMPMAVLTAQDLIWQIWGPQNRHISWALAVVGDITNDGVEDFASLAAGECGTAVPWFLWWHSGADGSLLREVPLPPANVFNPTGMSPARDWNNDGVQDVCVKGYGALSLVHIYSGVDGSLLQAISVGTGEVAIANLDVNGDGWNDVISCTANYGSTGYGEVTAWDHSGALLYTRIGTPSGPQPLQIMRSVVGLGDVDDDGRDDFAVTIRDPQMRGGAAIYSGATGTLLRLCFGELPGDRLYQWIDTCGDIDLDGYPDFVVSNDSGYAGRGLLRVFSSRTGAILRRVDFPGTWEFGRMVTGRGLDYDGDGVPDLATVTRTENVSPQQSGAVYVYSGRDESRLHRWISTPSSSFGSSGNIGEAVYGLKAGPGQHGANVLVGDRLATWIQPCPFSIAQGRIALYRGTPRTATLLGPACPGNLPSPPNVGMQSLGVTGVRVHVSSAPAAVPAVLLLGLSTTQFYGVPLPAALDPLGIPGCALRTSIDLMCLTVTGAAGQSAGHAHVDLPIPVPASGLGTWSVAGQWWVLGSGAAFPGGVTQAVTWRR